jgi:lipopolysaccharide biosynthesis regulator YciM
MKIRTLLYVVLFLAGVFGIVALYDGNRDVLNQRIHLWGDVDLKVSQSMLLFLAAGAGATLFLGISREFGLMMERRRWRRASRKAEEIEEEYSRGLVAVLEGREEEALSHFRAVLERDSRHYNTLLKIGEVLRHQEKHAEAIEYHRKAHHLREDDTQALYALVEDYEAKGDLDRARAVLGQIIGINKSSVSAWRKLRSLHVKQRNWEKALEAHERVVRYGSSKDDRDVADRRFGPGIRYEMAVERLTEGKPKEAIAGFRRVLKDDPGFIPAHVRLGEAQCEIGQEAEGIQAWYYGFELTGSPIFLTTLEEHYLQNEQPLAAIEALKRCISQARKDTLPRFYLGKLYFRLEMLDDAQAVLSSLEGRASYAPTLHYLLGRIHERRDNHAESALEYRKVIKEMELIQLEYRCTSCGETVMDWSDRCATCHEWNAVEVNFREEIALDDLGLAPAPIYTARTDT